MKGKPKPPKRPKPVRTTPSKAAIKRGNGFLAPALVLAAVLAGSATASNGDYVLILPDDRICAKSLGDCEAAQVAIRNGWLAWARPETPTQCVRAPGCFSPASNIIRGFNDK